MKYARLCIHDRLEAHPAHNGHAITNYDAVIISAQFGFEAVDDCPGGEFLAEFDLVKEASNDELIAELERRGVVGFVEWAGETP